MAGRVVYEGEGLKGMLVRAVPSNNEASSSGAIHDGGLTTTDGKGKFRLILTPGPKTLIVSNQKYSGLKSEVRQSVTVISDIEAPDVVLPPAQK